MEWSRVEGSRGEVVWVKRWALRVLFQCLVVDVYNKVRYWLTLTYYCKDPCGGQAHLSKRHNHYDFPSTQFE